MSQKKNEVVLIQCATPFEFEALRQAFRAGRVEQAGKRPYFEANTSSGKCVVLRGAVGKVWAAASAEFAIGRWQPQLMIDFGAAGGLVPELRVGDIVLAEKVIEYDVSASGNGLPQVVFAHASSFGAGTWIQDAPQFSKFIELNLKGFDVPVRVTRGRLASGDRDVHTLEERTALAKQIEAIAATWETSAIGRICKFHETPYLSIRVITDVGAARSVSRDEFLAEYRDGVAKALLPVAKAIAKVF